MEEICDKSFTQAQKTTWLKVVSTPVGPTTLVATSEALVYLQWGQIIIPEAISEQNELLKQTSIQLKEYFGRKRKKFDIPLAPKGTKFQMQVWSELIKIPFGEFITYGELAKRLGKLQAARAVGAANGKNPIGIMIPCHRVIGSNGNLTGFAGGLKVKAQLLKHESIP